MSERTELSTPNRTERRVNSSLEIARAFSKALEKAVIVAPVLATVAYGYEVVMPSHVYAESLGSCSVTIALEGKLADQDNSQSQTIEVPCNSITQIQEQLKNIQSGSEITTAIPPTPVADATPRAVSKEPIDQSKSQGSLSKLDLSYITMGSLAICIGLASMIRNRGGAK